MKTFSFILCIILYQLCPILTVKCYYKCDLSSLLIAGLHILSRQVRMAIFSKNDVSWHGSVSWALCHPPSVCVTLQTCWAELLLETICVSAAPFQIISNIHTVRATWTPEEPKVWKFVPRVRRRWGWGEEVIDKQAQPIVVCTQLGSPSEWKWVWLKMHFAI